VSSQISLNRWLTVAAAIERRIGSFFIYCLIDGVDRSQRFNLGFAISVWARFTADARWAHSGFILYTKTRLFV